MYAILNTDDNIIAFTDDRDIAEEYIRNIYTSHKVRLRLLHMSSKKARKLVDLNDLYLVLYNGVYVQSGYVKYLDVVVGDKADDLNSTKEVLIRLLVEKDLPKKTQKHIEKTIITLEKIINENKYTPSIDELRTLKTDYDPYFYSRDLV